MLNESTAKICRIIDGRLSCSVKGNNDLFAESSKRLKTLEKKVDQERDLLEECRRSHILAAFRSEVINFQLIAGAKPTLCLMNYRDVRLICEAWNKESDDLVSESIDMGAEIKRRPYVDTYSSSDRDRFIDGVRVKQGCDNKPGEVRFYSAESES